MDKLLLILKKINLPFAYNHFAEGEAVEPPFLIYLFPENNPMSADGTIYFNSYVVNLELYSDKKDIDLERKVEKILKENEIFYKKSEVWIKEEKLYEVLYIFEMEEKDGK